MCFAFLSRYARWMIRARESGRVVSFRLPLAIGWLNRLGYPIAKFVVARLVSKMIPFRLWLKH